MHLLSFQRLPHPLDHPLAFGTDSAGYGFLNKWVGHSHFEFVLFATGHSSFRYLTDANLGDAPLFWTHERTAFKFSACARDINESAIGQIHSVVKHQHIPHHRLHSFLVHRVIVIHRRERTWERLLSGGFVTLPQGIHSPTHVDSTLGDG